MITLFDAMLNLARTAALTRQGIATDGSTTTLTTAMKMIAGEYTDGTLFIVTGDGAGVAVVILDNSEDTLTFDTMTSAPEEGDVFVVCGKEFPKDMLIGAVDLAVMELAPRVAEDITTLTIANQAEYEMPEGVKDIVKVEIATSTDTPYYFRTDHRWKELTGEEGQVLRFFADDIPMVDDYIIRVTYRTAHVTLILDDDPLPASLDDKALLWQSVVNLCRNGLRVYGADKKYDLDTMYQEAQAKLQQCKPRQREPVKTTTHSGW